MIVTEFEFNHVENGYDEGFNIHLLSNQGVSVIEYLKAKGEWYPEGIFSDGVEISNVSIDYINNRIFSFPFMDYINYEITLGFSNIFENSKDQIGLIVNSNGVYLFTYILPRLIRDYYKSRLSLNDSNQRIDIDEFKRVVKMLDCLPFQLPTHQSYSYSFQILERNDYLVPNRVQIGI